MNTLPSPNDYATPSGFFAAYNDYQRQSRAERDAQFLVTLAELGARTEDCPCGYTPFDSCPVHD
jgi:hypothetical protein